MSNIRNLWMYGGSLLLVFIASSNLFAGLMSPLFPMPFYQVMLLWIIPYLVMFFVPAFYLLEVKLISKSPNFINIVNVLIVVFCILNVLYFWASWDFGYQYQGEYHTRIVALENFIGFTIALVMSIWSIKNKSSTAAYIANFTLFVLLSWCAFPYLGEIP